MEEDVKSLNRVRHFQVRLVESKRRKMHFSKQKKKQQELIKNHLIIHLMKYFTMTE